MAWLNHRHGFSDHDLENVFDLKPQPTCDIWTVKIPGTDGNKIEPEFNQWKSEAEYQTWLNQCWPEAPVPPKGTLLLVMHKRLEGKGMKSISLPYQKEAFRQTCEKMIQHRSIAFFNRRLSTTLFYTRAVDWKLEGQYDKSIVYHCRSDTESVNSPNDIIMSTTFLIEEASTFAVMYGCTLEVMIRMQAWLKLLKGPNFHPLILPVMFAEFERRRLLSDFSLQQSKAYQNMLSIEPMTSRIVGDEKITGLSAGISAIQETAQKEYESNKLWLSLSKLKNGLESLRRQLDLMSKNSSLLSSTVFKDEEHKQQRAFGDEISARLEEMIVELGSRVRTCDNLLGGMSNSMQIESNYYTRRGAIFNVDIAVETKRDSERMQAMSFLGMLFLPGTFFATMFSMTFFRFDPSQGRPLISPWFSLYVGVTLLCTIFIFLSWKWSTKRPGPRARAVEKPDIEEGVDSQSG